MRWSAARAPPGERGLVEEARAGMASSGHGHWRPRRLEAGVADAGGGGPHSADFVPDLLGGGEGEPALDAHRAGHVAERSPNPAASSPIGSSAARTRCTRRSAFMNVPSFSNELAAGRNTCAEFARRLVEEDVLHDDELQLAPSTRRVRCAFGLVSSDVVADRPQRLELRRASAASIICIRFDAGLGRERRAPHRLEAVARLASSGT